MKKFIIIGVLAVAAFLVYYTQIYIIFFEDMVMEDIPVNEEMIGMPEKTGEPQPGENQATTTPAPQIQTIREGRFVDADFFHKGSGKAIVLDYPDGRKILRFEDFDIINGPALYVYFSESTSPASNIDSLGDFIDLGPLKGNKGNQNYDLPSDIDLNKYKTVVIWCKEFGVLFPYAVLN
ncbi:MAG: DM13 domain-containing protein [bacterium]|nr:DM13 domain-containing protein [bacterium]